MLNCKHHAAAWIEKSRRPRVCVCGCVSESMNLLNFWFIAELRSRATSDATRACVCYLLAQQCIRRVNVSSWDTNTGVSALPRQIEWSESAVISADSQSGARIHWICLSSKILVWLITWKLKQLQRNGEYASLEC
jgi:hypothetical protein